MLDCIRMCVVVAVRARKWDLWSHYIIMCSKFALEITNFAGNKLCRMIILTLPICVHVPIVFRIVFFPPELVSG